MSACLILQNWWATTKADVAAGGSSAPQIEALARRYQLHIPDDFREYLAECCPLEENWDDEMGNWWPLARIKNIPDEYDHGLPGFISHSDDKFVFFLDHCIWCWAWAISCAEDETRGKVALIGHPNERYVADSFTEFVDRYTSDWLSVA